MERRRGEGEMEEGGLREGMAHGGHASLSTDHHEQPRKNKYTYACVTIASMIALLLGYDTGVMSGAMIFIKEELKVTDVQIEVLAGILNLCALVGSLSAGRISDWIGRRFTIAIASGIFFLGSALMGLAPSYAMLISGRCVAGVGVGFALMISPVYSAEISASSSRGQLTSITEVCINLGILAGYISNYGFAKLPLKYGWRAMLGAAAPPALALAVGIFAMPESPRWLVMQGRVGEARRVLLKVSNSEEEAQVRLTQIRHAAGEDESCTGEVVNPPRNTGGKGVWKELLLKPSPPVRRILTAAVGIHFFQHTVGIGAVVLYSPRIFKEAGISTKEKLLIATIAVGFTKTCFVLVSTFWIDKVGRRLLLLTSAAGVFISLTGLGTGLTVLQHSEEKIRWAVCLSIASVFFYVAFFASGLGPITWVYTSEIFPMRLRAQGASLGVAVNRVMNSTVSMSFISVYQAITIGGTFFLFAAVSALAWLFYFFFLPETKGRSLEEMEEIFSKKRPRS